MNWLSRFLPGGGAAVSPNLQAELDAVAALPAPELTRAHYETRYVIVNAEAGPDRSGGKQLTAVGAVAINQGLLRPADAFYAPLGSAPVDALLGLLKFVARAPVVVFNAPFNRGLIERAFEQHLGSVPELDWLDLMVLMPSLYPDRGEALARMDVWLSAFGIERLDQRNALLEAFAVAQLHQVALAGTAEQTLATPRDLIATQSSRQWLRGG